MSTLVLLRHGQSVWNQEKTFTGWSDVGLSERGRQDARAAGKMLLAEGIRPEVCFSSVLLRATETLDLVLDAMGLADVPSRRSWRLNERHYGGLQGLSFWQGARRFGLGAVLRCQRRYSVRPPVVSEDDPRFPGHDLSYADLRREDLPRGESLRDTLQRLLPCWLNEIAPELRAGKCVLIVSHRNLLRSLIKHLADIPESKAPGIKVPTATPLIFALDADLRVLQRRVLRKDS